MRKKFLLLAILCFITTINYAQEEYIIKNNNMHILKTNNKNKNLNNFWKWFKKNEKLLYNEYKDNINDINKIYQLLYKIKKHINYFSKGLHIEIENNKKTLNLIITPQGIREYFSDAFKAANYAPKLKYWSIQATKKKTNLKNIFIKKGNIEINSDDLYFIQVKDKKHPDKVIIKILTSNYDQKDPNANSYHTAIYNIIDEELGEISSTFDIDYIELDKNNDKFKNKLPISKLKEYLNKIKISRKFYNQEFIPDSVTLLKGIKNNKLSTLIVNLNYKHYSFKEKYPFLLTATIKYNVDKNGNPTKKLDELYKADELISEQIQSNNSCHFIYSKMYNGKRDLNFQCKDRDRLHKIIKVLKNKIEFKNIDYSIEYDPFWISVEPYLSY